MSHDTATTQELMSFWRSVPPDWYDRYDGEVEAACGWFGIIYVTEEVISAWNADNPSASVWPEEIKPDSYFITIDSDGNVWAEIWDEDEQDSALGAYARAEAQYLGWLEEDEE